MPPKAKDASQKKEVIQEEAPPPQLYSARFTAADLQETLFEQYSGEMECREIVEKVVAATEQEIVRSHMDHTAVPWTVQSVITDLMEGLQLHFVEREPFFSVEEQASVDVPVSVDQPVTIAPDSWSRASIFQRKALVRPDAEQFQQKQKPEQRRPASQQAASSQLASITDKTVKPLLNAADALTAGLLGTGNNAATNKPSSAVRRRLSLVAEAERKLLDSALNAVSEPVWEEPKTEEELRIIKEQESFAEKMSFLREVSDRVNKQIGELGRNPHNSFVVDGATNTVVPVNKPDPKKLPASTHEPKISIPGETPVVEEKPKQRRGMSPTQRPATSQPFGTQKRARKDVNPNQFWEPEEKTAPMVTGVLPAGGVLAREGDIIKKADIKPNKSRASKADFTKAIQLQQQQNAQLAQQLSSGNMEGALPEDGGVPPQTSATAITKRPPLAGTKSSVNLKEQQAQQQLQIPGVDPLLQQATGSSQQTSGMTPSNLAKNPGKFNPQAAANLPHNPTPDSPKLLGPHDGKPRAGDSHSPNEKHIHPIYRQRLVSSAAASMASRQSLYSRGSMATSEREISPDGETPSYIHSTLTSKPGTPEVGSRKYMPTSKNAQKYMLSRTQTPMSNLSDQSSLPRARSPGGNKHHSSVIHIAEIIEEESSRDFLDSIRFGDGGTPNSL